MADPTDPSSVSPSFERGLLATYGAATIVALPLSIALGVPTLFFAVLIVTLLIVTIMGAPIFLLIRSTGRANWLTVGAGGAVTGALFPALFILSGPAADQASTGGVATVVDGRYTTAGWVESFLMVGAFGLAGLIGAFIAWGLMRWMSGETSGRRAIGRRAGALLLLIAASGAGSLLIPWATADRSCHNPLRDGRKSIGPLAEMQLRLPMTEWLALRSELERFAAASGWSIRADTRPDPAFPWFQASLCTESGTEFLLSTTPLDEDYISISVYQPQGGDSWQAPLRALQDQLEARWPGKVVYRYDTYAAPRPPWAPPSPSPAKSSNTPASSRAPSSAAR